MPKYSSITWRVAFFGLLFFILAGCSGSDDNSSPAPTASTKATAILDISQSNTTATVNTPIAFQAVAGLQNGVKVTSYQWTFSDGQKKTGESVSASFQSPGQIDITLTATLDDGSVATTAGLVFVFSKSAASSNPFGISNDLGNVDGVAGVGVRDALTIAQAANGNISLPFASAQAGDIDLDGALTSRDVDLVMEAVLNGTSLPTAILSEFSYPGSVIAIVSPALLDPDAKVEVRVAGIATASPVRILLGYASFVVPSSVPVSTNPTSMEILVNGVVSATLGITIQQPIQAQTAPEQDIADFFNQSIAILQRQKQLMAVETADASAGTKSAINSLNDTGIALLTQGAAQLQALFAGSSSGHAFAVQFQQALYANGLAELRSQAASTLAQGLTTGSKAALTPDQICDVLIPSLCAIKKATALADKYAKLANNACSIASVGSLVFGAVLGPGDLAIAAGIVEVCVPIAAAAEFTSIAAMGVAPIEPKLKVSADPTMLTGGASSKVTASVDFLSLAGFCKDFGSEAFEAGAEKLLEARIANQIIQSNGAMKMLVKFFKQFGEHATEALLEQVKGITGTVLERSGLNDAIKEVAAKICGQASSGTAYVPASRVFKPLANDEGILQFTSAADGSANYYCAPPGPVFKSTVTLHGELQLCDADSKTGRPKPQTADVTITCGDGLVTIVMGDNGNALDDIFEVIINNETVLTSPGPVRSTSTNISLPRGRTVVTMRGLAAPDGIGTYFISFSGAQVVAGDPLTGTDLVPGATKQFTVEVP